jgi:heat shock protein HslJ
MIEALALASWLAVSVQAVPTPPPSQTPPYEGDWVVEVIDNVKVMPDSRITMQIRGVSLRGIASCNNFQGGVTTEPDGGLRLRATVKTLKACDPARTGEEADFFAILGEVRTYEVRGETLMLRTPQGRAITARRLPATQHRRQ